MIAEPKCSIRNCKHFMGVVGSEEDGDERPYCSAFPNGIPDEIAYGDNPHTTLVDGDHGIIFTEGEDNGENS